MHSVVATNTGKLAVSTVRKICYPTVSLTTPDVRWWTWGVHTDLNIELSGFNSTFYLMEYFNVSAAAAWK